MSKKIEIRAHHLFTFSRVEAWGAHKSNIREKLFRKFKYLFLINRGKQFVNHLIDVMLLILNDEVDEIKIINRYDKVCEKCPEKVKGKCKFLGITDINNQLQRIDEIVIKNTEGLLKLDGIYTPSYLKENIVVIRKALRKTLRELPKLRRK